MRSYFRLSVCHSPLAVERTVTDWARLASGFLALCLSLTPVVCCADVEIEEDEYEGRAQFVIRTENITWYYDRAGGGFSRLIDREGRDWIDFHKEPLSEYPASAAAGYRGIPNAVFVGPDKGAGHPGFEKCQSTRLSSNSLRTTSHSGKWQWTWRFENDEATLTMDRADAEGKWWFLYEGPIAGSFAPQRKLWGTNLGGPNRDVPDSGSQLFEKWRWIYFGDQDVSRVLFAIQHSEDDLSDTLWYLGSSDRGAAEAPDGMVVFGFGRGPRATPLLSGSGHRFTVGLVERKVGSPADHARLAEILSEKQTAIDSN